MPVRAVDAVDGCGVGGELFCRAKDVFAVGSGSDLVKTGEGGVGERAGVVVLGGRHGDG